MSERQMFEDCIDEKRGFVDFLKQPMLWVVLSTLIVAVSVYTLLSHDSPEMMSPREVEESIQVVWQDSGWVDKEVTETGVKIVPIVAFKIKNVGSRPLSHINVIGVFATEEDDRQLGDEKVQSIPDTLSPGQESGEVVFKSTNGYSASSKEAFAQNEKDWKAVKVRLMARVGAVMATLGEYPVKRRIEGV